MLELYKREIYFKDEKQRCQRKELFKSFHKLVSIVIASYLYHLFTWQASCITMTTMAVEAAIMQNKHCGTIPEGKSLNECNTFIGINVACFFTRISTRKCGLPEGQQLSTLVRVARSQRTTLQASSGSCGVQRNRRDERWPTSWRAASSILCTEPGIQKRYICDHTINVRRIAVVDEHHLHNEHQCHHQCWQYLVESQSVDELFVQL